MLNIIVYYCFDRTRLFWSNAQAAFLRLSRVLPTSRVFTSGYVNTETILNFFTSKFFKDYKLHHKNTTILLVFQKKLIYSCLIIPNCTRSHLITYTNTVMS